MFSSSKNSSLAQNASDGGQLYNKSIAPLMIYEGSAGGYATGSGSQTLLIVTVLGALASIVALIWIFKK